MLEPFAGLIAGVSVGSLGPVSLALGQLHLAAGDTEQAGVDFQKAGELARSFEAPSWIEQAEQGLVAVGLASVPV